MGWLSRAHDPSRFLLIRYEDLKQDPQQWFGRALEFIGLEFSATSLSAAIEASSFDRMRQVETQYGMKDSRADASIHFMRSGRSGTWRSELEPRQIERIDSACAQAMARLGYAPGAGDATQEAPTP